MRTMPSSPFSMARVGQASRQRGLRQCWQRIAKLFPSLSLVRTLMLASTGATTAALRVEQIISQVPQPVHFAGSKRMCRFRRGMNRSEKRFFSGCRGLRSSRFSWGSSCLDASM